MKLLALILVFIWSICIWEFVLRISIVRSFYYLFPNDVNPIEDLVFNQLDLDSNQCLSSREWYPYHQQRSLQNDKSDDKNGCENCDQLENFGSKSDEVFTIKTFFQPLSLKSTTQDFKKEHHQHPGSMIGLLNWQVPNKPWQNVVVNKFSVFLPPSECSSTPGSTWWIVAPQNSQQISSDHYEPETVAPGLSFVRSLFQMFHSGASLLTRFPPQGIAATLRAVDREYYDIVFRAHAEFQLNVAPAFPFWFTPAQFKGRLIMNKNASSLIYFSMSVPNERPLNVDMEWIYGRDPELMQVDVGYVPEMKLESTSPSISRSQLGEMYNKYIHSDNTEISYVTNSQKWMKEITRKEADSILEQRFYGFKQVPYYNITDVFKEAQRSNKLVHTLLLFGSLDDQSC